MMTDATPERHPKEAHRNITGGGARASVFGVSDGLVSSVSLILGVAGASAAPDFIRIAGLAGLLGGAFSMAAGEYVSMRAQAELLERELSIERLEIARHPKAEREELARIYESRGISQSVANRVATDMMASPESALETHAREELGITPNALGSPSQAAILSFVSFAVGALVPLLPYLLGLGRGAALAASIILASAAALAVGAVLAFFTARGWWRSAFRSLAIAAAAGSVTFGIGAAIGVARGG